MRDGDDTPRPTADRGRVLVTGATGYIGGRLVPRLLDAGWAVRCLVRSPRKLNDRPWIDHPRVDVVRGDLADDG
ncbi:MAG TPA: NAD(P)H-binding protein, partial [Thermoanaerobaculia bacterium]|nr:NAD(P)H-binding protein [Thermoanaerobaculia bacterium]